MKQSTDTTFMRLAAASYLTKRVMMCTVKVDGLRTNGLNFTVLRMDGTRHGDYSFEDLGEAIEDAMAEGLE